MPIVATGAAPTIQELSASSLALASLAFELRALWSERGQCEDIGRRARLLRQYHAVYADWDRAYAVFEGTVRAYFGREAETAVRIRDDYAQRSQTGA